MVIIKLINNMILNAVVICRVQTPMISAVGGHVSSLIAMTSLFLYNGGGVNLYVLSIIYF